MAIKRAQKPFRVVLPILISLSLALPPASYAQMLQMATEGSGSSLSGSTGAASMGSAALSYPSGLSTSLGGLSGIPQIRQNNGVASDRLSSGVNTPAPSVPDQPARPLPPNEFQKFILESTGQSLPLFGASFFTQAANSYVPLANTPVSPDYAIGPGDEVLVRGWGSVDIDVRGVVDRNGLLHIPRVGAVQLAGVKSSQAEGVLRTAVGRYYRDFQLSVTMGQLRGITVYVVGQARKPGAYTLSSVSTVISALFASGGPGANGSMRNVQVKRSDRVVAELDLYAFLARGDKSGDIKLQDGDAIVIPAAKGFMALTGKVNNPAVYEISGKGDSIENLLTIAGGLPVTADPKRATLERVDPSHKPSRSVESFALDAAGLKRTLRNGDTLAVQAVTGEFGNAVTLRGNVDQPLRMPWKEGMTIRDLIPSKSFLMSRGSVKRQNEVLLTPEDKQRALLGFTAPTDDAVSQPGQRPMGQSMLAQPAVVSAMPQTNDKDVGDTADTLAQRIGNLVDEVNMDYAVVERVDRKDVTVKLLPFSLNKALEDANSPDNLALQPGDTVTVFSVNDVQVPQSKRQVFVRVEGEVNRPGIYQMKPGDGLKQMLEKAGGVTPDAYLFGAAFYREEVRRAQLASLDQLVRRLEAQVDSRLSAAAASVSGSDSAGVAQIRVQAEAQAQKQALQRLRNLKPTGRIMLGLNDKSRPDDLPALKLENQDRLVIPARPDFVYVLGSVNTESSLIWQEGKSVQFYLDQSGLTSGADKDEMFVIRADGSVLSAASRWFGTVSGATVSAGDVIVLPEKTDHESAWSVFTRNAKDITQIVYQLSLGAAAIKTLRD